MQPAASAGPILRVPIARGKFHGVIISVGPTGCFIVSKRVAPFGAVDQRPLMRTASSENHRKNSAAPAYRTPVPLCLIRGEADRTGNIATAMPRWARAEAVDEIVVAVAGHMVSQDAPGAVNEAITAFLQTVPSPPEP